MNTKKIEKYLFEVGIPFELNVDLKKKTWIHRGGIASVFVIPQSVDELEQIISYLYSNCIRFLLIGCTSNIYILNSTNIPVVVSTLRCNKIEVKNDYIECECGVQVCNLAKQMIEEGIKGFEYLTKLPGTVGAAIYNNSTVMTDKNSIVALLIDLEIVTPSGLQVFTSEELHFEFRTSDLKKHIIEGVILRTRLRKEGGDKEIMTSVARTNEEERSKLLEGPVQNLGCTVHRAFCNGPMPLKYRLPCWIYSKLLTLFVGDRLKKSKLYKEFILYISGHKRLIPYVSDKLMITFIWRDEKADIVFDEYLQFMREVYKTDKVEIEIIK